eukprot:381634_1
MLSSPILTSRQFSASSNTTSGICNAHKTCTYPAAPTIRVDSTGRLRSTPAAASSKAELTRSFVPRGAVLTRSTQPRTFRNDGHAETDLMDSNITRFAENDLVFIGRIYSETYSTALLLIHLNSNTDL